MQFNPALLQSVIGQTQGAKATAVDGSNVLDSTSKAGVAEFSNEFLSLLTETKALAESGVSPEEFIETLNTEELGLSSVEKKALAKSFIGALEGESEGQLPASSIDPDVANKTSLESDLNKVLKSDSSELKNILNKNQKVLTETQPKVELNNSMKAVSKEGQLDFSKQPEAVVDPKITNGKLISIKEHSAQKNIQNKFQSSEDFIAQAKVANSAEVLENEERKSFFPKSNNKVLAFNNEQNSINKNIFAGKNPFTPENEIVNTKTSTDAKSLEGLLQSAPEAEVLAPMMSQNQSSGNQSQNSFGNSSNVKVLDFSNINTANTEQLISKISNYITTSRLENQDHVELIVKHNSLGNIKVTATKGQLPDQVNIDIIANSDKGHQFFKSNEVEMIKTLSNSGVKLNDVKISMNSDFNFQSSDKGDSQFNQGQASQHSRQNSQGSSAEQGRRDRREQMWDMYRERLGA